MLFSSNSWPVQIVLSWLGGVAMTHGTDANGQDIYCAHWPLQSHPHLFLSWTLLLYIQQEAHDVSKHELWHAASVGAEPFGQKKRSPGAEKGKPHHCMDSSNIWSIFHFSIVCSITTLTIVLPFVQTLKPLMEKRRRARINESLNHLKSLILPLTGRDVSYTRMILIMINLLLIKDLVYSHYF